MITIQDLQRITLFASLSPIELEPILSLIKCKNYPKDSTICHKGDHSDAIYFLFEGQLQVIDVTKEGREVGISIITPGTFFGEIGVIDGGKRSATIKALKSSVVGSLNKEQTKHLFYHSPKVAEALMIHLTRLVRNNSESRALLAIPNAFQRVYVFIQQATETHHNQLIIQNLPTQQTMASQLNTSRETVSRALSYLIDEQIIQKNGKVYIVLDQARLEHLAEHGLHSES